MKICNNCGAQLSCGCQRRTASDGTPCCDQCLNVYEAKINTPPPIPTAPKVVNTVTNKPTTGKVTSSNE